MQSQPQNRKLHKSKDKFPFFHYFDGPEMRLDQAKISLVGHHDNPLSEDNFEPSCIKSLV